jgi:hypothetical protein
MRLKITALITMLVGILSLSQANASCIVHDHTCAFHNIGRAITTYQNPNPGTEVRIVSRGSNNTDFDNNVLLENNQGPYVVSTTGFPTRADQPYISAGEQPRHVYPSQYQIISNNNTLTAAHSGDFNGLEIVPGATGCTVDHTTSCEEVKFTGNFPTPGDQVYIIRQTNHLYNAQNVPNPDVTVTSYAAATGKASVVEFNHGVITDNLGFSSTFYEDQLTGTGAKSAEHRYYIRYSDHDPAAIGTALIDFSRTHVLDSYGQTVLHRTDDGLAWVTNNYQDHQRVHYQRQISAEGIDRSIVTGAGQPYRVHFSQSVEPVAVPVGIGTGTPDATLLATANMAGLPEGMREFADARMIVIPDVLKHGRQQLDDKVIAKIEGIQSRLDQQGVYLATQARESEWALRRAFYTSLSGVNAVGHTASNEFLLSPSKAVVNCADFNCTYGEAFETATTIPIVKGLSIAADGVVFLKRAEYTTGAIGNPIKLHNDLPNTDPVVLNAIENINQKYSIPQNQNASLGNQVDVDVNLNAVDVNITTNRGAVNVTAASPSASELAAAEHMAGLGRNVNLRDPVGERAGGGTSDLLVNGVPYDVYTPISANPNRIISAIAKKNDQATGIIVDLSNSPVTAEQLGNVLDRVNRAGATNITDIVIIGN